jgi:SAM-dependent methyltransferase
VFAFEVLEHVEADLEALRSWINFLKPGGRILVSVPAHMRKYSDEDRGVGHYRRYEKCQLEHLLQGVGCAEVQVLSYGFPIATLTRRCRQLLSRWTRVQPRHPARTPEELSIMSGVERSDASLRLANLLNRHTLAPFIALQRPFFDRDLGDGYVAHAVRLGHEVGGQPT